MSKKSNNSGIGVLSMLGVLFVGLKLTGYLTWSWWWVTLPFWMPMLFFVIILAVLVAVRE